MDVKVGDRVRLICWADRRVDASLTDAEARDIPAGVTYQGRITAVVAPFFDLQLPTSEVIGFHRRDVSIVEDVYASA